MFKAVALVLVLALAGAAAQDIVSVVESNPDFSELYARLALVSMILNLWWVRPDSGQWSGSCHRRRQLARGL